jgi:hypothetical protein
MDVGWDRPKQELNGDPALGAYRRSAVPAAENRALRACAAFGGDVLVVESEDAAVIPSPVVANYLAAFARARSVTHRVIAGADHGLSREEWRREYTAALLAWLRGVLPGAPQLDERGRRDPPPGARSALAT